MNNVYCLITTDPDMISGAFKRKCDGKLTCVMGTRVLHVKPRPREYRTDAHEQKVGKMVTAPLETCACTYGDKPDSQSACHGLIHGAQADGNSTPVFQYLEREREREKRD